VAVQFRAVGESGWREALPLLRIGGEHVYRQRENWTTRFPRDLRAAFSICSRGRNMSADFN